MGRLFLYFGDAAGDGVRLVRMLCLEVFYGAVAAGEAALADRAFEGFVGGRRLLANGRDSTGLAVGCGRDCYEGR